MAPAASCFHPDDGSTSFFLTATKHHDTGVVLTEGKGALIFRCTNY